MSVLPGVAGSINAQQKSIVVLPATNATSAPYAYTPSVGATAVINGVTLTKKTTVDQAASGNRSLPWKAPTITSNIMSFDGTQSICYGDNTSLTTTVPYSGQVDFNTTTTARGAQYILNNGEGFGIGWCEWAIQLLGDVLTLGTNSNQLASGQAYYDFARVRPNEWYRVGFMFFNTGGTNYVRGYLNGVQKFQFALIGQASVSTVRGATNQAVSNTMPANAPNGISIGGDANNYDGRMYYGQVRNVIVGKQLFWSI